METDKGIQRSTAMGEDEARSIEVGARVLCVDGNASFNRLVTGSVYTVDAKLGYAIGIGGRLYSPGRFSKVAE